MSLTYSDYWSEIADLAETVTSEAREQDREIGEVLWETLDSHSYVIYTAQAQQVLVYSPNDGAMIEECGGDGAVKNGCLDWSVLAYWAMQQDVIDHDAFNAEPEDDD